MSTLTASVDLPVTGHTVRDARVATLDLVEAWDCAVSRLDLALLVDDLTEDVVAHAGGESSLLLEVTLSDELLHVGIADGSAVRPVAAQIEHGLPPGVLHVLAHRWGHETYRGGHRVWFELTPPVAVAGVGTGGLDDEDVARMRAALGGPARAVLGGGPPGRPRTARLRDAARRLVTRLRRGRRTPGRATRPA
jgi:hypothetical protein